MKLKLNTTNTQNMTASEIENLALHIISQKGNYDFADANIIVNPPSDMDAFYAGIIVACSNGRVIINGATQISNEWLNIVTGKITPSWFIEAISKYNIPQLNLIKAAIEWNDVQYAFHANNDGKYLWLIGDGNAYIITDYLINTENTYEIKFKGYDLSQGASLFGNGWLHSLTSRGGTYLTWFASNKYFRNTEYDKDLVYIAKCSDTNFNLNGVYILDATDHNEGSGYPIKLFTGLQGVIAKALLGYFIVNGNVIVPFKRNNEYGMLDLMTNTFYGNANSEGSFICSLE